MAQAGRLFAELSGQGAPVPPRARPASASAAVPPRAPETSQAAGSDARLSKVEAALGALRALISDLDDRVASLERTPSSPSSSSSQPASTSSAAGLPTAAGLPVVGSIPKVRGWRDGGAALVRPRTPEEQGAGEAYRALRASLMSLLGDQDVRSVQVTSPQRGEGRTTTAANLAVSLARAGNRVVAMCCDLQRPRLHELFGLSNEYGLTSVLDRLAPLRSVVQEVPGIGNLMVVTSGPVPTNSSELILSERAAEVITVLQTQCDFVVIDSPPVLADPDAVALAGRVQGTLVVVNAASTASSELVRAVAVLRQAGAPLLGVVVNARSPAPGGAGPRSGGGRR